MRLDGRTDSVPPSLKCATCNREFTGERSEVFRLLRCHTILHELQSSVRQRLAELEEEQLRFVSAWGHAHSENVLHGHPD